jgi:hypothetical protein
MYTGVALVYYLLEKSRADVFYLSWYSPFQVSDKDDVSVGRIRQDLSQDDNRGYNHVLQLQL